MEILHKFRFEIFKKLIILFNLQFNLFFSDFEVRDQFYSNFFDNLYDISGIIFDEMVELNILLLDLFFQRGELTLPVKIIIDQFLKRGEVEDIFSETWEMLKFMNPLKMVLIGVTLTKTNSLVSTFQEFANMELILH